MDNSLERLYCKEPKFKEIARCESGNRQFENDGTVLIGRQSADKGRFQINYVHWDEARELGIDLNTVQGNAEFAEILYERNGLSDWYMSKHCWG